MSDTVDAVVKREGGLSDHPADTGGRTYQGISETWNADLWKHGPPTDAQVRERYEQRYIKGPGFDRVADRRLREQLVDFGVHSGPGIAIQKLQEIVHTTVDGVLGPETLSALGTVQSDGIGNMLVAARVRMLGKIVTKNPSQLVFLNGWLSRALEFLVL